MIHNMVQHSFEDNTGFWQLTEVLKICWHMHFFCSCFSAMVSFRYVFLLFDFSQFCFMSNKYCLSKLNGIIFSLYIYNIYNNLYPIYIITYLYIITYILNLAKAIKTLSVIEVKDFLFENYYSMKHLKHLKIYCCLQTN